MSEAIEVKGLDVLRKALEDANETMPEIIKEAMRTGVLSSGNWWICACHTMNHPTYNFCPFCGSPKPRQPGPSETK